MGDLRAVVLALCAVACAVHAAHVAHARQRVRAEGCCELPQCPQPCGSYITGAVTRVVHDMPRTVIDEKISPPPPANTTRRHRRRGRNATRVTASVTNSSGGGLVSPVIVPKLAGLANVPVLEYDACQQAWVLRCRTIAMPAMQASCLQQLPRCGDAGAAAKKANQSKAVKRAKRVKSKHASRLQALKEREKKKKERAQRLSTKTKDFKSKLAAAEKALNKTKKGGSVLSGAEEVLQLSKSVLRDPVQLRAKAKQLRQRAKKLLDEAAQLESGLGSMKPKKAAVTRNKIQVTKLRANNLIIQAKSLEAKADRRSAIDKKIRKAKAKARNVSNTHKAKPLINAAMMIRKTAEKAAAKGHAKQAKKLEKKAKKFEKRAVKSVGSKKNVSSASVTKLLSSLSKKNIDSAYACNKMLVLERYLKKRESKKAKKAGEPAACKEEVSFLGQLNKKLTAFCKARKGMKPGEVKLQESAIKTSTKAVVDAQKRCRAAAVPARRGGARRRRRRVGKRVR